MAILEFAVSLTVYVFFWLGFEPSGNRFFYSDGQLKTLAGPCLCTESTQKHRSTSLLVVIRRFKVCGCQQPEIFNGQLTSILYN